MTILSSLGLSQSSFSPRTMMNQRIDAAAQSGSISETDEAALETALDAIDSALGVGASSGASGSSSTSRLDPSSMKDRVDSLIEEQVSAGTLTEDQAAMLQNLFAQGGSAATTSTGVDGSDALSGVSGAGSAQGMRPMGPPPPPPSETDSDEDSATSADASTTGTEVMSEEEMLSALIASLSAGVSGSGEADAVESDGMTMGGIEGIGGMRPMGPPPPPPPADASMSEDISGTTDTASTSSDSSSTESASAEDQLDALISFLNNLRQSLASQNVYSGTSGSTSGDNSGLVIDALA